jgi:hypothetical protein
MPPVKKEKKEIITEKKEEITEKKDVKPKTSAKSKAKVEEPDESSEPEVKPKSKAKPKAKPVEEPEEPVVKSKAKAKPKGKTVEVSAPVEEIIAPSTTKSPEVKKLMDEWSDIQKEIVSISSTLDQKIKRREEISSDIWKLVQTAVCSNETDIIDSIPIKTKSKAGKNVSTKANETAKTDTKLPILDNADESNSETDLESLSSCSSESEPSCDEDD